MVLKQSMLAAALLAVAAQPAIAQSASVGTNGDRNSEKGYSRFVLSGGSLHGEYDNLNGTGYWDVAVRDLDLATAQVVDSQPPEVGLYCKGNLECARYVMTAGDKSGTPIIVGPGERLPTYPSRVGGGWVNITCESASECASFLQALRAAGGGLSRSESRGVNPPGSGNPGPRAGAGPANGPGPIVNPAPAVSDVRDKKLPPEPILTPQQQDARKLLDDARNLAKPTVDCNALRSTYSSGPTRTLPAECMTDIERASTYLPKGGGSAQPGIPSVEEIIDGSKIPSAIDFSKSAFDRIFVGPPRPPQGGPDSVPTPPSNQDREPDTPIVPEPRVSETPLPGSTIVRPAEEPSEVAGQQSAQQDGSASGRSLSEKAREALEQAKQKARDAYDKIFGRQAPESTGPQDTLAQHQRDIDNSIRRGPLETQRVLNQKMDRILDDKPLDK